MKGSWRTTIGSTQLRNIRAYKPKSVLPGHGPLARDAEIDRLLEIESYFLTEVRKRVEQGMSLNTLLAEMEANLPDWISLYC